MEEYSIDKEKSFLIGDSIRDLQAAKNAGIRGYLFNEKYLEKFVNKCLEFENK